MRPWLKWLLGLSCLLAAFSLGVYFGMPALLSPIRVFRLRPEHTPLVRPSRTWRTPQPSAAPAPAPSAEQTQSEPAYAFGQGINVLVLGYDMSVERARAGLNARTDAMILAHIDFEEKAVALLSLPRDTLALMPSGRPGKINAAFAYAGGAQGGGFAAAAGTVGQTLGVSVDYTVGVDMNAAKEVVDALGGIDVEVDIAFTINGRRLEAGFQHLTGQQALDFCRFRHAGRGDLDRADRQKRVLVALLRRAVSTDALTRIPALYQSLQGRVYTDLSLAQIASLAYFAPSVRPDEVRLYTLPGNGRTSGGVWYYIVDERAAQTVVAEAFGHTQGLLLPSAAPQDAPAPDNPAGQADAAALAAERLLEIADAADEYLMGEVPVGTRAQLQALLAKVPEALAGNDAGAQVFLSAQIRQLLP